MGVGGSGDGGPSGLTPRQQKWFASVKASLERDTGKTLEEWAAIARTCPETKPKARSEWLRKTHGLGANYGAQVLMAAFPAGVGWDEPDELRKLLWTDPASAAILEAVERLATALPDVVTGQRKAFTAFSREFQFASMKPMKGGKALLGLAVAPDADPRLEAPKNESWSERLKSKLLLESADRVDGSVEALLKAAWEKS
jgi:hypothetical protein